MHPLHFVVTIFLFSCFLAFSAKASPVRFGGFVDTYYAYDFNNPSDHERQYTTQPSRSNEFNVNLAHLEAVVQDENTRGRFALQYGSSVTKNYSSEPNQDVKFIQEAYVGKRIGDRTWVDAGIFLGNIGAESWISKDNWTYSRALSLDYVPYYSSGVRFEHKFDDKQSLQLQILNGWQNIAETNSGKAIGMQYKNILSETLVFTYNNFFGDEKIVSSKSRFRSYHNFILQWLKNDRWQYIATFDIGHQSQQQNNGTDFWGAAAVTIRRVLNETQSLAFRGEHYSDPHQANIVTGTPNGFQVSSASLNFDQKLDQNSLWRTEIRGFYSEDKIYPQRTNSKNRFDGFLATSLSMWF